MKRLCIYAHWDRDNIIDDYVIYYLEALKKVCNEIIFVSDCNLNIEELSKLKNITKYYIAQKHGEYDFGSYKRGFQFALNNNMDFEELVFANDSCYGPFFSFETIFNKMDKKKCDFWGMTSNRYGVVDEDAPLYTKSPYAPHIQSYFIVFRKNVWISDIFSNFINSIKEENRKNDIITKYEIGLSQLLYKNGFKSAKYVNKYHFIHNPTSLKWDKMIKKDGYPFLKTTIVKNGFSFTGEVKGWQDVIKSISDYPIEIIEKNRDRLLDLHENKYAKLNLYRKIRFNILRDAPLELRCIIIFIEKYSYIILNALCFNKLKKF